MSDYMFMLESHLTGEQNRVLALVRAAAEVAGVKLFLTGGAMRDMMGGFPIRDLDFTVEGAALKLAKNIAQAGDAEIVSTDELRKAAELRFSGGVRASISMARQERYPKPATKPQVQPATIHEDLRCRDFTVNAIALSLGNASRGLLLDPENGLGDLASKELRATGNHTLYDDPARILRMLRLKVRLGFTIDSRTWSQYQNVREAKLDGKIPEAAFRYEVEQTAIDPQAGDILKVFDDEKLLDLLCPAIAGPKLNLAGFQKLQKTRQSLPFGTQSNTEVDWFSLFLIVLFDKLGPKERSAAIRSLGLDKVEVENAAKLEVRAKKAEKEIATLKSHRPSVHYWMLSKMPGEVLVFILIRSSQRVVLDRIKNYFQKYLPLAQEVTEKDVLDTGALPGTPKYAKVHQQLISAKLDARPKKVIEEPPPPPPVVQGRRSSSFARS